MVENEHETIFELTFLNEYRGIIRIPFSGRHLLWNALGCIGIGLLENMPLALIEEGLGQFENAARRFKVEVNGPNVYIDDYAHHPTEVSVTIDAARLRYPNHKLIAIFKPHRVSRLYHFADAFAKALDKADEVYLCGFSAIDDQRYLWISEFIETLSKSLKIFSFLTIIRLKRWKYGCIFLSFTRDISVSVTAFRCACTDIFIGIVLSTLFNDEKSRFTLGSSG